MDDPSTRRVIEVGRPIGAAEPPRLRPLTPRKLDDYPHLPAAYRDVAGVLASPLLMGPPICDELMALVRHLFTEEEAGACRHLGLYRGRTAAQVARAERRPVEQVAPILKQLAEVKRAIVSSGPDEDPVYRLLPLVPGMFEMMLIGYTPETLTDWHRR